MSQKRGIEKLYMTRPTPPSVLVSLVFFRPQKRWKRLVCWLLDVTYHHVSIHVAASEDLHYIIDYPKGQHPAVLNSADFVRKSKPALILPISMTPTEEVMERLSVVWAEKNRRWPSLRYRILRRLGLHAQALSSPPVNCALLAAQAVGLFAWTPDELYDKITRREHAG